MTFSLIILTSILLMRGPNVHEGSRCSKASSNSELSVFVAQVLHLPTPKGGAVTPPHSAVKSHAWQTQKAGAIFKQEVHLGSSCG